MLRVIREAYLGFTRSATMSLFAVFTTAFSLLTLGLFMLMMINMNALILRLEDKVEVMVYLKDDAESGAVGMAIEELSNQDGVARIKFISKEEALDNFRDDLGADSDLLQDLETNPVPASINITMKPGYRDTLNVGRIARYAEAFKFVEEVDYGREWLRRMDIFKHTAWLVGVSAGSVLALISIILVSVAIKIAIYSRSKEIFIMKTVGATNGYIRRSFLFEGFMKGIIGGALAAAMIYAVHWYFSKHVMPVEGFSEKYYFYCLAAGALMGWLGSWVSLGRHLKKV